MTPPKGEMKIMHRPNLNNMSATDRATLAGLIQQYVTPAVTDTHWNAVLSGAHNDPAGFLSFHRNFTGEPQNAPVRRQKPAAYTIVPRGTLLEIFL